MAASTSPDGPLVIDASVWVAALEPADCWHQASVAFLQQVAVSRTPLWAPDLLMLEVACAVTRRTGRVEAGRRAGGLVAAYPGLRLQPLDAACLALALRLGTAHHLRAADAVYLAVARYRSARLVTWDREMIERAGAMAPA